MRTVVRVALVVAGVLGDMATLGAINPCMQPRLKFAITALTTMGMGKWIATIRSARHFPGVQKAHCMLARPMRFAITGLMTMGMEMWIATIRSAWEIQHVPGLHMLARQRFAIMRLTTMGMGKWIAMIRSARHFLDAGPVRCMQARQRFATTK